MCSSCRGPRPPRRPDLAKPVSGAPSRAVTLVGRRARTTTTDTVFPTALADWLAKDAGLLESLLALRRLGPEGRDALEAVLSVRRVAALKASWALWEALTEGDGEDPEALLLRVLPLSVLEDARRALWGSSWRDGEQAQPRRLRRVHLAKSSR
jgi:hypothetical protein